MKILIFKGTPKEIIKQIITLGLSCQFRGIKNPTIKDMMEVL